MTFDLPPPLRDEQPPADQADLSHTRSRPSTPVLDGNDEADDCPAEVSDSEFGPNQNIAASNHGTEHRSNALDNAIHNDSGSETPNENAKQGWTKVLPDRRKLTTQFYDNLVFYAGLQTFHDEGAPPPYRFDRSNLDSLCETELRQLCLDCIAYLCDFSKSPGTTAAAALQKLNNDETVLWISANEGFPMLEKPQGSKDPHTNPQDIPKFIGSMIQKFRAPENRMSVRAELFRSAIHLATPRMDAYRQIGLTRLERVLESPKLQASTANNEYWEQELWKLKSLMEDNKQLPELAEWCYQNRKPWSDFIERKGLARGEGICWFEELKHYLYRLSTHAFAVDMIEKAVQKVDSVRKISKVEFIRLRDEKFWTRSRSVETDQRRFWKNC
jgi:hypothetical protein